MDATSQCTHFGKSILEKWDMTILRYLDEEKILLKITISKCISCYLEYPIYDGLTIMSLDFKNVVFIECG